MRFFAHVLIIFIFNNASRLPSFLFSSHFPCLHTSWVPLLRRSQLFQSPCKLTSWTEGIHWFLTRINRIHVIQAILTRLEKLIVLISIEDHVLLKLFLELVHNCIYHASLLLLLHLLLCVHILVWINQLLLLHHCHWLKLHCLQFSLFEQLVIS